MKRILFLCIILLCSSGCSNNYTHQKDNDVIEVGVYKYLSSPYCYYTQDDLSKYFTDTFLMKIRQNYMPYIYSLDEYNTVELYTFQETEDLPEIIINDIEYEKDNVFNVSIQFGEIIHNYKVLLKEGKICNIEKRL